MNPAFALSYGGSVHSSEEMNWKITILYLFDRRAELDDDKDKIVITK